jgi:hypothetical protein
MERNAELPTFCPTLSFEPHNDPVWKLRTNTELDNLLGHAELDY